MRYETPNMDVLVCEKFDIVRTSNPNETKPDDGPVIKGDDWT